MKSVVKTLECAAKVSMRKQFIKEKRITDNLCLDPQFICNTSSHWFWSNLAVHQATIGRFIGCVDSSG